ncbi:MAG: hypothetical protein IIB53_14135 [Planctomycetes bacterium]|nr:hypothetical protein [Planctomycetota bacterium]
MVRAHEDVITSDQLERMLSPRYLSRSEWAGWWTKARLALKKHPNIALDGRNPIVITYVEDARAVEDQVWSRFDVHACPKTWLELAKKYIQECKIREQEHQPEFILRLADAILKEAATLEQRSDDRTLSAYLTADAVRQLAGEPADDAGAVRILERAEPVSDVFLTLPAETYWAMALACLKRIRSEDWPEYFANLIPIAAPSRCDELAREIRGAGRSELLGGVVQTVLASPVANVNGLCWLYLGPKDTTGMDIPPLTTLVSRIMGVLDQFRQSSAIPAEAARDVRARIRSTLSAKKCARFKECLEEIDVGMADALRTQLRRDHGLSEAVRNDLLNCIRRGFPALWHKPKKKPWEDESTLYCTQAGYTAKEAELEELVNVKLRENAIAIGKDRQLLGIGAGQVDRVTACRIAIEKAGDRITAQGATIAASDAFFPFTDGPQLLIDAGVKCIVHPGGSKRDQETLDLCNQHDVTCLLTGIRHFRH